MQYSIYFGKLSYPLSNRTNNNNFKYFSLLAKKNISAIINSLCFIYLLAISWRTIMF